MKPSGATFFAGGLCPFVGLSMLWLWLTSMAPSFGGVTLGVFFLGILSIINMVALGILWAWAKALRNEGETPVRGQRFEWAIRYAKVGAVVAAVFVLCIVLWPEGDGVRFLLFIVDRAFPAKK